MKNIKLETFKTNFNVLNKSYRLSELETSELPGFIFLDEKSDMPVKQAALELYESAQSLSSEKSLNISNKEGSDIFNEILRAKFLAYEISDYFSSATEDMKNEFLHYAESSDEELKSLTGKVFKNKFRMPEEFIKAFCFAYLSGANVLYKKHNKDDYARAEKAITRFYSLPSILSPDKSNVRINIPGGVMALARYLEGKILSVQGKKSEVPFLESLELYAEALDSLGEPPSVNDEKYFEKRSLIIRRMTTVSAFGVGYGFLIKSQLMNAIRILSPARAMNKHFAGKVFAAYTEYLYRRTKRAKNSSDMKTLLKSISKLNECLDTFHRYVPDSYYIPRTEIEIALCEYYLSKLDVHESSENVEKEINKAGKRLEKLIFIDDQKQEFRSYGNNILSEALTMLSYIAWHDSGDLEKSLLLARKAVDRSEGTQYHYEALLAEGSCYYRMARTKIRNVYENIFVKTYAEESNEKSIKETDYPKTFSDYYDKAYDCFNEALLLDTRNNPRIIAIAQLKMVELNLLRSETFPLAEFHFRQWEKIEDKVEHSFIKEKAAAIKEDFIKFGQSNLIVRFDENIGLDAWKNKLTKFLISQVLSDMAENSDWNKVAVSQYKPRIAGTLQEKLKINRSTAYKWIDEENLVKRLKMLSNK